MESGQLVRGTVVEHRQFGLFVNIGEPELGLAVITMLEDEERVPGPDMPPVGQEVDAVLPGYSGPGRQPRLSLRPSDIARANSTG